MKSERLKAIMMCVCWTEMTAQTAMAVIMHAGHHRRHPVVHMQSKATERGSELKRVQITHGTWLSYKVGLSMSPTSWAEDGQTRCENV